MMKQKEMIESEYLAIEQKVLSAKTKQHQYDTYCMMYDENSKKSIFFLVFAVKCRII